MWQRFFTFFNCVSTVFKFLQICFKQFISILTGRFIVSMISFILSSFDILPSLSDLINFHRDTSRMTLASSGDHGSRFYIRFRDASVSSDPLIIRFSSASILGMYSMVS